MMEERQTIQLRLLGTVILELIPGQTQVLSGKVAALLGYLVLFATEKIPVSRSKLAGVLWENQTETKARRALTRTLHQLKQILGKEKDRIITDDKYVSLAKFSTDIEMLESLSKSKNVQDWRAAVALYRGALLEESEDDWCSSPRKQQQTLCTHLLKQLSNTLLDQGNITDAMGYAHQWSMLEPYQEEACENLMKLYTQRGQHGAALWQYKKFEDFLLKELGVYPPKTLQTLRSFICLDFEYAKDERTQTKPWVGRKQERGKLLRLAQLAAKGKGQLVFLEGEAGIGKTRLLESVASGCIWRDFKIAWGTGVELEGSAPYTPFDTAFHQVFTPQKCAFIRKKLNPNSFDKLSRLFPNLLQETKKIAYNTYSLHQATLDLLRILTTTEPMLLILDDLQWAQPSFWELLLKLAPAFENLPILVILSYRSNELRLDISAWEMLQELDILCSPSRISLSGLSLEESQTLASLLQKDLDLEQWSLFYPQTNGNPLHLVEGFGQLYQGELLSLIQVFDLRLRALPQSAQKALDLASVLGKSFTYDQWKRTSDEDILPLIPKLLETRCLEETEEGYTFSSDLLREHVYNQIEQHERKAFHQHIATDLQRENIAPQRQAWHFEQARQWPQALDAYQESIKKSEKLEAYASAFSLTKRALLLLKNKYQNPPLEWDLRYQRISFYKGITNNKMLRTEVQILHDLLPQIKENALRKAMVLQIQAEICALDGELENAITMLKKSLKMSQIEQNQKEERRALRNLSRMHRKRGEIDLALEAIEQALSLPNTDPQLEVGLQNSLAAIHLSSFEHSLALPIFERALETVEKNQLGDIFTTTIWNNLIECYVWQGELGKALVLVEKSFAIPPEISKYQQSLLFSQVHASNIFSLVGKHEIAAAHWQKVQKKLNENRNRDLMSFLFKTKAKLLQAQRKYKQAISACEQAIQFSIQAQNISLLSSSYCLLGALHHTLGDNVRAKANAKLAQKTARPIHSRSLNAMVEQLLARISLDKKEPERAKRHFDSVMKKEQDWPPSPTFVFQQKQLAVALQHPSSSRLQQKSVTLVHAWASSLNARPEIKEIYLGQSHMTEILKSSLQRQEIRLLKLDTPQGKRLQETDYHTVFWTPETDEDQRLLQTKGKAHLRRHRILRLVSEAKMQNAISTDQQLAKIFDVSVRTIERDMNALYKLGHRVQTQGRNTHSVQSDK